MNTPPDGLLCHCPTDPADPAGHPVGVAGCATTVPATSIRPFARGGAASYVGDREPLRLGALRARGTCPDCGRSLPVRRIETRAVVPAARPGRSRGGGPLLAVRLGITDYSVDGAVCPGRGKPPAETRYTPGRELDAWLGVHGPGSVA